MSLLLLLRPSSVLSGESPYAMSMWGMFDPAAETAAVYDRSIEAGAVFDRRIRVVAVDDPDASVGGTFEP